MPHPMHRTEKKDNTQLKWGAQNRVSVWNETLISGFGFPKNETENHFELDNLDFESVNAFQESHDINYLDETKPMDCVWCRQRFDDGFRFITK